VLQSLLVDGIIGGVGGVIVFLPNILLLFLAIAILEDSGYMARAAFIMDRVMHKIGLHGKSFIPMLIGFGCSVPAIMATRTLENRRDRLTTMLVLPLMSCGARLPIYALIIPAFFPEMLYAPMLWLIYVIGILLAVLGAKVLRSTILRGESTPFVMELPPYRMPTLKGVLIHMWERGWLYLKKAGTIISGFPSFFGP
jgi:ferrous iron transport protein B